MTELGESSAHANFGHLQFGLPPVSAASAARENRHATTADVWPFSSLVSRVALVQGKKLVSYTCHALQRDAKGCNGQSPEGLRCVEDGRLLGESPGI